MLRGASRSDLLIKKPTDVIWVILHKEFLISIVIA